MTKIIFPKYTIYIWKYYSDYLLVGTP